MKRQFVRFGVIFLGVEAWVALREPTSVLSWVIGCASIAVLACYFVFRVRREVRAIGEDNRQARERREARKGEGANG